jgi:hypothetical protein
MNSYRICLRFAHTDQTFTFKPASLFEKFPIHLPPRANRVEAEATEYPAGKTTNDWRFGHITIDWIDQEMSSTGSSGLSAQEKDAFSSNTRGRKSTEDAPLSVWRSECFVKMSSPAQQPRSSSRKVSHGRAQRSFLRAPCTSFEILVALKALVYHLPPRLSKQPTMALFSRCSPSPHT